MAWNNPLPTASSIPGFSFGGSRAPNAQLWDSLRSYANRALRYATGGTYVQTTTINATHTEGKQTAAKATHDHHHAPLWKKFIAGSLGGIADVWACHALDRIKTDMQNHPGRSIPAAFSNIWSKGGIFALYEGVWPMTAEAIVKVGLRFFTFDLFKRGYQQFVLGDLDAPVGMFVNMMGGAFAGAVESLVVVIPCELLKVRHMTQPTNVSFGGVFVKVVKEEGVMVLYKGGLSTMLRQMTNQMIRFPIFYGAENVLKRYNTDHTGPPPVYQKLLVGGFAGVCSTMVNNPLDTIKTHTQKQGQHLNSAEIIKHIYQTGGLKAFWAGVVPRMARVVPGQAITWAVVSKAMQWMGEDV